MESSRTWGTTRGQILLGVLLLLPVWPEPGGSGARRFSGRLDERVAAQKAIEEVYWRHRSWPESNRTAKPPLSSVMSEVEIQAKVEDYLRQSAALERYWSRPITGEQLQAELDRLTSSTRNEAMLRELFEALGDDPLRIAETLARQTLVDRLIRSWYAYDERFHANVRREAEQAVARAEGVAAMQAMGGDYLETTLRLRDEPDIAPGESRTDATLELGPDEWSDVMAELGRTFGAPAEAIPVGQLSELQEDEAAFFVTAVLSRADDQVVVAQVTWPKRTFDSWWSAERTPSTSSSRSKLARSRSLHPRRRVHALTTRGSDDSTCRALDARTAAPWSGRVAR